MATWRCCATLQPCTGQPCTGHVPACRLQAELGRNRRAFSADARPAGSEHARLLQRLPHRTNNVRLSDKHQRRHGNRRYQKRPKDQRLPVYFRNEADVRLALSHDVSSPSCFAPYATIRKVAAWFPKIAPPCSRSPAAPARRRAFRRAIIVPTLNGRPHCPARKSSGFSK
jgi:hypothetical protein